MIDPSIITNGANNAFAVQQDSINKLGELGGGLGRLILGRRINQMNQLGSIEDQQAFANKSIFAPHLNQQLKSNAATAFKNQLDLDEHSAKIGKMRAETGKLGAESNKIGTDTAISKVGNQASIWSTIAQGGGVAGKNQAAMLLKNGLIDQAEYDAFSAQIDHYKDRPAELMQYAFGQYKAMQDPKYSMTTADNVLNNETSIANNKLDNQTSRHNNQEDNQTTINVNEAKLNQDQSQFDANLYVQQNKPLDYFTAADGTRYAVYANGQGIPITNGQGAPIKEKPKSIETPVQKMERQEKTIDFANGAKSAAEAAQLAAGLANDLDGINSAAGGFGLMAKVPGSDAKAFATKLETLKSNVFLQQVGLMKGMGALTDAEGARLEKSIAALDLSLSPVDLQNNLTQITQILSQAAKTSNQKAQLYSPNSQAVNKQPQPSTPATTSVTDFFK